MSRGVRTSARLDRTRSLGRLADERFDVLVIGGGITGAGIALDAAARGLAVGLVERGDFAGGTSSRSTKLVHGGLRYLQQGQLRLVAEGLAERRHLLHNAPHLVERLAFVLPIFRRDGFVDPRAARAMGLAMWGYDLAGGFRIGKLHERLNRAETVEYVPALAGADIAYSYIYYDAQTDDARLVISVARTAAHEGAALANYARADGVLYDSSARVCGARVNADDRTIEVRARAVINATGVWGAEVAALDRNSQPPRLRPAKGVHLAFPRARLALDMGVVLPVPGERRTIFAVPWRGVTIVGTTDTDYRGPLERPRCSPADADYLIGALNAATGAALGAGDVIASWAGLRPLIEHPGATTTADLSRRHSVTVSNSGLITIVGGKLTSYRSMAADAVDQAMVQLGRRGRSLTKDLPLYNPETEHSELIAAEPDLAAPLSPRLPYRLADVAAAVRAEAAVTVDDVLARRTRARLIDARESAAAAPAVAEFMARELGWPRSRLTRELAEYRRAVEGDLPPWPETSP